MCVCVCVCVCDIGNLSIMKYLLWVKIQKWTKQTYIIVTLPL